MIPKFRAWHKKTNEMHDVTALEWLGDGHIEAWFRIIRFRNQSGTTRKNETIIMQSTGLKDKNGKEIFEGDMFDYGATWIDVVKWNPDRGGFGMWCPSKNQWDDTKLVAMDSREVIGNIYENPDLLEVKE